VYYSTINCIGNVNLIVDDCNFVSRINQFMAV